MWGFQRVVRLSIVPALGFVLASPATAFAGVPAAPNAVRVLQDCDGSTSASLFLHPGLGKALWDITTDDVANEPGALIKAIDHDVYLDGEYLGTFHYSFGNKVGLGEPVLCTYHEQLTTPDGVVDIWGTSYHVVK